jgi:hypothetical protein
VRQLGVIRPHKANVSADTLGFIRLDAPTYPRSSGTGTAEPCLPVAQVCRQTAGSHRPQIAGKIGYEHVNVQRH